MPFGQSAGQGFVNPGTIITTVLKIIGAKGKILIYSPTEGPGNLIGSWAGQGGTDSSGNTYPQGLAIFNDFLTIKDPAAIIFTSGASFEGASASILSAVSGVNPAQFMQLSINSPATNVVGATDRVYVVLNSAAQDNSSDSNLELLYQGSNGNFHLYASLDATGFNQLAGNSTAADPNTLPGAVSPETWHNFSIVTGSAGVDQGGISYPPQYMLLSNGDVAIAGVYVSPAGGLVVNTTWATIPALTGYRPATNFPVILCSNNNHGTIAHLFMRPNGNMQFNAALGATVSMNLDGVRHIKGH